MLQLDCNSDSLQEMLTNGLRAMSDDDRSGRAPALFVRSFVGAPAPHAQPVGHTFAVLGLCLSGRAEVEQHGRWQLREGDVLLVPAGEPHRMLDAHRPTLLGLGFSPASFAEYATLLEPFAQVRRGGAAVLHVPAARQSFLRQLLLELAQALERNDSAAELAQRSLFALVLDELQRAPREPRALPPPSLAAECLRVLEQRCLEPFSLRELAAELGRTPSHVTTALRRATGQTALEWMVAFRMAEARRRLLHSDERVDVIAERVGYQDATHFIRTFRRQHGVTPARFRRDATPGSEH